MPFEVFLRPKLTGKRFEDHSIPLSVLKDLSVLDEMITDVAKWRFLRSHPGRQRVPRGFTEGIELRLMYIDEGSAVPVIGLDVTSWNLLPEINQVCYFEARESILRAIKAAEENKTITEFLPEQKLSYFNRIGRDLHADETIEFQIPDQDISARLTRETRRRLLRASTSTKVLSDITDVRGTVPEADQDDMTFELQLADGKKIPAPILPEHLADILDAFNEYNKNTKVLLHGIADYTRAGRLKSFQSIESISLLDPLDVQARIEDMSQLQDGWRGLMSVAPDKGELEWFVSQYEHFMRDNIPNPRIYPTDGGGIQVEWIIGSLDISLEIELSSRIAYWHCLDHETSEFKEFDVDLNEEESWMKIASSVAFLVAGQ